MQEKTEYGYHSLKCKSHEEAAEVMQWLEWQRELGVEVSVADIVAQFPNVELCGIEQVPPEIRAMAERAVWQIQQEEAVQERVDFINKVATIFFGFGSTAVVLLHRYWLNADVEAALWLVQSWWIFPIWIGVLGFSWWLWPKE